MACRSADHLHFEHPARYELHRGRVVSLGHDISKIVSCTHHSAYSKLLQHGRHSVRPEIITNHCEVKCRKKWSLMKPQEQQPFAFIRLCRAHHVVRQHVRNTLEHLAEQINGSPVTTATTSKFLLSAASTMAQAGSTSNGSSQHLVWIRKTVPVAIIIHRTPAPNSRVNAPVLTSSLSIV